MTRSQCGSLFLHCVTLSFTSPCRFLRRTAHLPPDSRTFPTLLTPTSRAPFIAAARAAGFRVIAYFFPPDLPNCLTRNSERAGKARVPDVALLATATKLTPPNISEGFDAIFHVQLNNNQFIIEEI